MSTSRGADTETPPENGAPCQTLPLIMATQRSTSLHEAASRLVTTGHARSRAPDPPHSPTPPLTSTDSLRLIHPATGIPSTITRFRNDHRTRTPEGSSTPEPPRKPQLRSIRHDDQKSRNDHWISSSTHHSCSDPSWICHSRLRATVGVGAGLNDGAVESRTALARVPTHARRVQTLRPLNRALASDLPTLPLYEEVDP